MRTAKWTDFEILDTSSGERLERWADVVLVRPDPQIIWNTPRESSLWKNADARYKRSKSGGGKWEIYKSIPNSWEVGYKELIFKVKPMGFKHTGVFPEQGVNWDFAMDTISKQNRKIKILNLFAYTGGATLACAKAGAFVCHVDSSKGMVLWAKENLKASQIDNTAVRWIVDDCVKFVAREVRRGNKYDGIIMDPPSYGRGPNGEVWKLEENLFSLIEECKKLLSDNPLFFILNSYTTGLSASVMGYMLEETLKKDFGGKVLSDEIGLTVTSTGLTLPCGTTSVWSKE